MALFRDVHPGNAVLLVFVVATAYAAVLLGPGVVDHYNVRAAVQRAHAQAATASDAQLRFIVHEETRDLDATHLGRDAWGQERELPGLGDDQIVITRDPYSRAVRVQVLYPRALRLRPTSLVRVVDFGATADGVPPPHP